MFSFYTQIGIGALACMILLLVVMLLYRSVRLDRVLYLAGLLAFSVLCFVRGTKTIEKQPAQEAIVYVQSDNNRYLVSVLAVNGKYGAAVRLAQEGIREEGTEEDVLLLARIFALQKNYDSALAMYCKAQAMGSSASADDHSKEVSEIAAQEFKLLLSARSNTGYAPDYNGAVAEYLEENNIPLSDYGYTEPVTVSSDTTESGNAYEEYVQKVEEALKDYSEFIRKSSEDSAPLRKTGDLLCEAEELYQTFTTSGRVEEQTAADCAKSIAKQMKNDESLEQNEAVRNALLRVNAMIADYEAIAENFSEFATTEELMVVSELYINGEISKSNFRKTEGGPDSDAKKEIERRCKEILKAEEDNLATEEADDYDSKIELLSNSGGDAVLKQALYQMTEDALTTDPEYVSKEYLQAAKGYNYVGQPESAESCIEKAFETVGESSDPLYTGPMKELIEIMNPPEDINGYESVKNIPALVQEAVNQTMPIPIAQRPAEEPDEEPEKPDMATGFPDNGSQSDSFLNPGAVDDDELQGTPLPENTADETAETKVPFTTFMADTVSKKSAMVNISHIDKSNFPKVTATVSFGSDSPIDENNIHDYLEVYDCEQIITNYTAAKRENTSTQIILLCDVSGSMDGSEEELKKAIRGFADGMTDKERVAVVGFHGGISFSTGFTGEPQEIRDTADRIYANGGTNMYSALLYAGEMFEQDGLTDCIIILMTDGQDNNPQSGETLKREIGAMAADKNCTVYALGLGNNVDTWYLNTIAEAGNGQFMYVDSADSLDTFYRFIHTQISNRFVITYQAIDELLNNRVLKVELKKETGTAKKTYYLKEPENESTEAEAIAVNSQNKGLSVTGLSISYLYRSSRPVEIKVFGSGFQENVDYTVKLQGALRAYPVGWKYEDENTLLITVPETLAVDTYAISVNSDKENAKLDSALVVAVAGTEQNWNFGDYHFTFASCREYDDRLVMTGNVTLNGWLHFIGDVTISGDYHNDASEWVTLNSPSGAYISYSVNSSKGLAHYLAAKGYQLKFPSIGNVRIYSEKYDQSSYKDFPVQKFTLNAPVKLSGLADVGGTIALYPDMLYMEAFYANFDFTYVENLLKNLPKTLLQKDIQASLTFTNTEICTSGSVDLAYEKDNDTSKKFQLGTIGLHVKSLKASFDTIVHEAALEGTVGFDMFKIKNGKIGINSFGLAAEWKENGFDSLTISAGGKVMITQTPMPLYLSNMGIGVSGLSKINTWKDILKSTVEGSFQIVTDDLIEYLPKLEKLFGKDNLYLAEIDDAKISVTLGEFNINFAAKLKLLGIQLAQCTVNLGKFAYTNALLGMYGEDEYGVGIDLGAGIDMDWKNLSLDVNGDIDLTLGYPFSGVRADGQLGYDVHWWIFSKDSNLSGSATLGAFKNSIGELQFSVAAKGSNEKGKYSGFRLDVSKSKGVQKTKY